MHGKVVDYGVILGDDGNNYEFSRIDLKEEKIEINDKVEFEINENRAINIYKVYSKNEVNEISNEDPIISSVKIFGIVGSVSMGLAFIYGIGLILAIAGLICLFFAISKIATHSKAHYLKSQYIKSLVLSVIAQLIISVSVIGGVLGGLFSLNSSSYTALIVSVLLGICGVAIFIYSFVYYFKVYKKISILTNNSFFLYQTYFYGLGIILKPVAIGWIFTIIGGVLSVIAWATLKEIKRDEI